MTPTPKEFFTNLHDVECNQKYNKTLPYSFHLEMVYAQASRFDHVLARLIQKESKNPENLKDLTFSVVVAVWGHDSIEDARLTYNDILLMYGVFAADIIYLCTDWKGKNRLERKPVHYYEDLSKNKLAVFVKLCDIIANIKFGLLTNSSMYETYKTEWTSTKFKLTSVLPEFKEMVIYINNLLEV